LSVAFIADEFPPTVGGIATYSRDVVAFLARRGAVGVWVAGPPARAAPHVPPGTPVFPWPAGAEAIRERGATRVLFNHLNLLEPARLRALRREGRAAFCFVYGADIGLRHGPGVWLARALRFALCRRVVAISGDTAAVFRRRYPFLPPPALLRPGLAAPPAAAPESAPERDVIAVGRLVDRKGFDTLLRAAAILRASRPGLRLTIAGDGPQRDALYALRRELGLDEAVRFVHGLDDAARTAELRRHRVFCLLPRVKSDGDREGFGIVFLEAAAQGLPVVAGRSGGVPDAVADGENGRLVDPLRPAAAAAAMDGLLGDEALRARMARASLAWAARFHWPHRDPARELAFLDGEGAR
jgi:phosphatidyl-myo-inositol dimannoside synthase